MFRELRAKLTARRRRHEADHPLAKQERGEQAYERQQMGRGSIPGVDDLARKSDEKRDRL